MSSYSKEQHTTKALIFGVIGQYDTDIEFSQEDLMQIQYGYLRYQALAKHKPDETITFINLLNNIICKYIADFKPVEPEAIHFHSRVMNISYN
jgi:hypothetical protein